MACNRKVIRSVQAVKLVDGSIAYLEKGVISDSLGIFDLFTLNQSTDEACVLLDGLSVSTT